MVSEDRAGRSCRRPLSLSCLRPAPLCLGADPVHARWPSSSDVWPRASPGPDTAADRCRRPVHPSPRFTPVPVATHGSLPKKKRIICPFRLLPQDRGESQQVGSRPPPKSPTVIPLFFFNLLVFFYEILRVSSNRTGFICHSVNQNSFSVTRPRVCSGKVIDVLKNLLEVSWAPRGPSKRRLRRAPHAGGFPSCRQVFPGAREGSGSIRNGSRDGGGGRGGGERSQGTVSQALGLPLHSCSLFPPPHPRPRLLSVREGVINPSTHRITYSPPHAFIQQRLVEHR